MANRQIMLAALKQHTIPLLTARGFSGKYPNFKRNLAHCIELISFQINKHGGSFTVEVSAVFPYSENKNCKLYDGITEETFGVEATNERYRLPGMFDGWFYYRDVYRKRTLLFGSVYYDVPEKEAGSFLPTKGYRLIQAFNKDTAVEICNEVNVQLEKAFTWLDAFERKNNR